MRTFLAILTGALALSACIEANPRSGSADATDTAVATDAPDPGDATSNTDVDVVQTCRNNADCIDNLAPGPCQQALCTERKVCELVTREDDFGCDDGDPCTQNTRCLSGVCGGGGAVVCAPDGNPCTDDSCVPDEGCIFAPEEEGTACDNASGVQPGTCGSNAAFQPPDACDGAGACLDGTIPSRPPPAATGEWYLVMTQADSIANRETVTGRLQLAAGGTFFTAGLRSSGVAVPNNGVVEGSWCVDDDTGRMSVRLRGVSYDGTHDEDAELAVLHQSDGSLGVMVRSSEDPVTAIHGTYRMVRTTGRVNAPLDVERTGVTFQDGCLISVSQVDTAYRGSYRLLATDEDLPCLAYRGRDVAIAIPTGPLAGISDSSLELTGVISRGGDLLVMTEDGIVGNGPSVGTTLFVKTARRDGISVGATDADLSGSWFFAAHGTSAGNQVATIERRGILRFDGAGGLTGGVVIEGATSTMLTPTTYAASPTGLTLMLTPQGGETTRWFGVADKSGFVFAWPVAGFGEPGAVAPPPSHGTMMAIIRPVNPGN